MEKLKVAIMATGGIDSTVLLYQAWHKHEDVIILTVDYGHVAFQKQKELLEYHSEVTGYPLHIISVPFYDWQKKKGLFTENYIPNESAPLEDWDKLRYQDFFIEGRNLIMMAYALGFCSSHRIDELRTGYLYAPEEWENRRSYKMITGDNSPHFVDMMNLLTLVGFSYQVRIRAPFYESRWDKEKVVTLGKAMGLDLKNQTYSCYFVPPCGVCDNCLLRKKYLI